MGWWRLGVLAALLAWQVAAVSGEPQQGERRHAAEPPRVRAARRFLARRGGAGKQGLRATQDASDREAGHRPAGEAGTGNAFVLKPELLRPDGSSASTWTPMGPVGVNSLNYGLVTGRISSIALDPADSSGNTVFVGTTGGGVWKSQNAAASTAGSVRFVPLTDNLTALSGVPQVGISVGAVAVQPGGTGVVLAGLGDPNDALDSYYGAGLLRSADGGQTWSLIQNTTDLESGLGMEDFRFLGEGFAGFAWSTANSQVVVAAVSQAYEGTVVDAGLSGESYQGLYWSNDAGATWHLARITDLNGLDVQGPMDGFVLPDGNAATAVVWNPVRQVFVAAVRYHGYYQSADGMNWTRLANQPGAGLTMAQCPTNVGSTGEAGCPIFRGSLAVNPQTGDTFAWTVDGFNQDQGIWQDQCGISGSGSGASCTNTSISFATRLATTALESADGKGPATIENGDYNLTLTAVPAGLGGGQDTLLFAGDNDLWKCSLANGCVWRNTTNATTCMSAQVAEYQHAMAYDVGTPLLVYVGTDGGLWRSIDQVGELGAVCSAADATHWQNLNGALGSLAEVDSLGQSGATAATMLAGLGAQGTAGIVNAPATAGNWNEILGGEGGPVAVTPGSSQNSWYANNGAGVSIFHCSATGGTLCTAASFGTTPVIGEAQVGNDGLTMTEPAAFRVDALDPTQLVVGTCRVWRGPATGSGWTAANAISPILDGGGGSSCNGDSVIRSIGVLQTTGGGEVIYAGMAGVADGGGLAPGHLFSATIAANGTVSGWTDLSVSTVTDSGLAFNSQDEDVSAVYVDPHDPTGQTVYATVSGFTSAAAQEEQVYRSTTGGAVWASIMSNLPNAPVNGVVVDPQDASTVYVATDAGVYVTRAVASCGAAGGSTACWAAYGAGLPMAPVTALTATPVSATSQVLTAGTYGRGVWQIPTVTAGTVLTAATVSPASLTFATTTVGSAATAQTIVVKNTGSVVLSVTNVAFAGSAAGDFSETDTCKGTALATNATCTVKVTFAPQQTGSRAANVAIVGNVSGGQLLVPVSGTGQAAGAISVVPANLSFAQQQVGTTSAGQNIGVQNTGGSAVSITSIVVSAPFKLASKTCGSSLGVGVSCAVTVTYAPTAAGAAAGTMTVTDSVGTQTAQLSGTGVLGPTDTLSATSLAFPGTVQGQASSPMTVTLTNSGGLPLTSISVSVKSDQANGDYKAVSNCGSQLAANSSCGITVTLTPSLVGSDTATMSVSDALKAQSVRLTGSGLAPPSISVSPTSLAFGGQQINVPSPVKSLTVVNRGGAPLAQPSFSFSGPGAGAFSTGTTTCGATLAANVSCTVQIIFTPTIVGAVSATLTAGSSSSGVSPVAVGLSGTGLTPPILGVSPAALNLGTVDVGFSSNVYSVQVMNLGQVAMTLPTFAVTGITGPSGAQNSDFSLSPPADINACTAALAPTAYCYIQVTFSPSVAGTESATLVVSASNAVPPIATVSLTGVGAPPIVLQSNVTGLQFPATPAGTSSAPLTLTLSNLGRQAATGMKLTPAGAYGLNPTLTNCGSTLGASSSCTAAVVFSPQASGDQPGSLTASVGNVGVPPLVIALDGSGLAVGGFSVQPSQLTFGSVVTGTTSSAQTLTITNSGGASLTGMTLTLTGDFALVSNTCPATLAAGASCTTGVTFKPSGTGNESASLTLSSTEAGSSPAVVPMRGTGIPPGSIAANPPVLSFGSVTVGQSGPVQTVTLQNTGSVGFAGLQYAAAGDYRIAQNNCAATLAAGASCTLSVGFGPTQPGTRIGSVTISSSASGFTPVVVGLTGTGLPAAQLKVTPAQLSFGTVPVGANSASQTLTISNPGTADLQGLAEAATAPFAAGSGSCGTTLAAGASCTVPVTFSPASAGSQSGTVTVSSTSIGVPAVTVSVTGTGQAPGALAVTPSPVNFPGTEVGVTSAGMTVTVSNSGGQTLAGLTVAVTGDEARDFLLSSTTCTSTLAAGASCSVTVAFAPTVVGGRQAFLTASTTNAGVAAVSAILTGAGLVPPVLGMTPAQLTFGATQIGQVSATQLVTVTNSGQAGITDLQLTATAGFGVDATQTKCTSTLGAGASCVAGVFFAPTASGAATGAVSASSKLTGASVAAALNGTASVAPGIVISPAAVVQFGTTGVGVAAPAVPVTVTNPSQTGAVTGLTFAMDTTAQQNGFGISSNSCGNTLAAGATCTVNVGFSPATYGPLTGTLTIQGNGGVGPVQLQLAGIGFSFQFVVSGSNSATVVQGQVANYTLALTSQGSAPNAGTKFSFTCGNLPANAVCAFNPAELPVQAANVTGDVALQISTSAPMIAAVQRPGRGVGGTVLVIGMVLFPLGWRRRRGALRILLFLALLTGVSAATGCVSSEGKLSGAQQHSGIGTPPGSYPVQVTASANGVTKSLVVTITVD